MPRRKRTAPIGRECNHYRQRVVELRGVRVQLCQFCDAIVSVIGKPPEESENTHESEAG